MFHLLVFLFYGIRIFFKSGALARVRIVSEDLPKASLMIVSRRQKWLKMGIAVTIFGLFFVSNYAYATSACWSVTAS